jgi:hypothetical protein
MPSVNLKTRWNRGATGYRGQTTRALPRRCGWRGRCCEATAAPPAGKPPHLVDHRPRDAGRQRRDVPAGGAVAGAGANVIADEFARSWRFPPQRHRPGGRPGQKAIVYARILELLGKQIRQTDCGRLSLIILTGV